MPMKTLLFVKIEKIL